MIHESEITRNNKLIALLWKKVEMCSVELHSHQGSSAEITYSSASLDAASTLSVFLKTTGAIDLASLTLQEVVAKALEALHDYTSEDARESNQEAAEHFEQ